CFVRLDERKKLLSNWLPALVVRIVAPIEFRWTLFIISSYDSCDDCLRRKVFYTKCFYGLLSDGCGFHTADPLESIHDCWRKLTRRVDKELIVSAIVHFALQRFDRQHNAFFLGKA